MYLPATLRHERHAMQPGRMYVYSNDDRAVCPARHACPPHLHDSVRCNDDGCMPIACLALRDRDRACCPGKCAPTPHGGDRHPWGPWWHCRMPAGVMVLQDISHDTPARSLSGRGIALRPRKKAGSALFCIKQNHARMQQAWPPGRYRRFTGQGRVTIQHPLILNPMGARYWIMISYPPPGKRSQGMNTVAPRIEEKR
jgi:hypothetical protein